MNKDNLTCKELVELVTDYFENALTAEEKMRFETHLRGCKGCTQYVEQMRQTIALTGQLTEGDVPPVAEQALREIFRDWKRGD